MLLLDINTKTGVVKNKRRGEFAMVGGVRTDLLSFFRDEKGEVRYCKTCEKCTKDCKQSFRVLSIQCNKYERILKKEA